MALLLFNLIQTSVYNKRFVKEYIVWSLYHATFEVINLCSQFIPLFKLRFEFNRDGAFLATMVLQLVHRTHVLP